MRIHRNREHLARALDAVRRKNETIGFVPTMGALHQGHLSIVRHAKKENDRVVVSVFVNPLQFGPKEDYRRYPRNLRKDASLLNAENTDWLFAPDAGTLYPDGFQTTVKTGVLARRLCGPHRPGHFDGVATVVLKLLEIVRPDSLYLGQKDYQQFVVLRRMARDLDLGVHVKMAPTVREKDGLAMSSRNAFLSLSERRRAPSILAALRHTAGSLKAGRSAQQALREGLEILRQGHPNRIDYFEIVDAESLEPMVKLKKGGRAVIAAAVYFGRTRLIDNILIEV